MSFVHDDPEFDQLLQMVASRRGLGVALVEKDYWVTHTLWALHAQGFDIWFKGGTSLSKRARRRDAGPETDRRAPFVVNARGLCPEGQRPLA